MDRWSPFYAATAAAAAALLGLLFVAVSINAAAAIGPAEASSRRLTEQAYQNYLAVMLVSFMALFPGVTPTSFGGETVAATATWSLWVLIRFGQAVAQRVERRSWIFALRRHLSSLIGFAMLLVAALRMAFDWGHDENWVAAAMLMLMFSAIAISWELLKRIAGGKAA
jgi:hypothetical protein